MNSFELSAKAKFDLKNIARYTHKRWGRAKRNIYLKQLDDCFHLLANKPSIGLDMSFIKQGYRKFPQSSHMIIFKLANKNKITIIRILHHKMDVKLNLKC